ncbi:MAG: peptidoglycan-binding protein [Minisyncoccia bacterium]
MSITNTNTVAKVAAVIAGLGLVAMSFASFAVPAKAATTEEIAAQIAALTAELAKLQGGTTTSTTFTRDLTIGATGADVTALQTWLIGKGFAIPAGATGYFGTQTAAAVAAYQTANGIAPAAGYFGPITRAKVNAMAGTTTGGTTTGGTTTTGGLSGGEADLSNFDLIGGDDVMEGDTDVEIAVAKFDVDGGDARIERVTVDFHGVNTSYSEKPWDYVDSLSIYLNDKKIGDVDAGSKDDWDEEDDDADHSGDSTLEFYSIDVPVDGVVEEGDEAELSIRVDAQSSIDATDLSQTFKVQVPDDGVRAVDAEGIQQYVGDGEEITLGFDAAEDGDLTVKKSSDTPISGVLVADTTDTSDEFDVLKFEIKNSDDADAILNDLKVRVATSSPTDLNGVNITDIIRNATLTVDGDDFSGDINSDNTIDFDDMDVTLAGDETTEFTLSIELFGQSGHFVATGHTLTFRVEGGTSGDVDAEGDNTGDSSTVSGTATGEEQSVAVDGGVSVEGSTMSATLVPSDTITNSYGTFTVKYDITAVGDDVYIPKAVGTAANTSGVTASTTYLGSVIDSAMSASTTNAVVTTSLTTTADSDNTYFYVVHEGDTETFTVSVSINPNGTSADLGSFQVGLDKVKFSAIDTNLNSLQTLEVDQSDADFHTDPLTIAG